MRPSSRSHPNLILTHCRGDLHQDHRLTCELTWNTFRDHLILEYEIPKYDGDLGTPNFYVPSARSTSAGRSTSSRSTSPASRSSTGTSAETFLGLMRIRGLECHVAGHAEALLLPQGRAGLAGASGSGPQ